MKPAGIIIRWFRIAIWLIAILAVGGLMWPVRTITSYGGVCAKCLQHMSGREVKYIGIPISDEQKLDRFRSSRNGGGGFFIGTMPAVDPANYTGITGSPCVHSFKRTGYCRFGNGFACGHFGEGSAFRPRLETLDVVLRTFGRIPNRDLGQASLKVLDHIFPPDAIVGEASKLSYDFEGTIKNLETMMLLLAVVETPEEWRTALDHFEGGFQGRTPFISDASFVGLRMNSTDSLVRRGCAAIISRKRFPESRELLSAMLGDPDDEVAKSAGGQVFLSKRFELFGKLLRRFPPDSHEIASMTGYADSDFSKLFGLDDPMVDDVCFEAIARDQRLNLLDIVVERLNHRDSKIGRATVARLLRGSILGSEDDSSQDPWEWLEASDVTLEQAERRVRQGHSRSSDFWLLLKSMKTLSTAHDPVHWTMAKRVYEQAADDGISEFHMSILAKALMEIDPARTVSFLIDELGKEGHQRLVAALAGMGLIASPVFIDSIEHFQKEAPAASAGNPYPPKYYFKNGEPAKVLRYALHRCRGVQDWRLLRDGEGRYFIRRT